MADKKKGLLESVVDSVLHPSAGSDAAAQSGSGAESTEPAKPAATAKVPKGAKKQNAVKVPSESAPEGMQMPEGPVPGDYVERGPLKKEFKHPKDYAAGAVDKMGEVVHAGDKSDEQK